MRSAVGKADSSGVREAPMSFGHGPKGGRMRVIGKHDPHNHGEKHAKVKIYVGSRKALEV